MSGAAAEQIERALREACLLEVLAPKAGNVHPGAAFEAGDFEDFALSALVTAPILAKSAEQGVGASVLAAVRATREAVGHNTNLGLVLLLAPVAAAAAGGGALADAVEDVLGRLGPADAAAVYEAIRLAEPAGLGEVAGGGDVREAPREGLVAAMARAADRDRVAAAYAGGFAEILERMVPALEAACAAGTPLDRAIQRLQLEALARHGDSLVRRKRGEAENRLLRERAGGVLEAGWPASEAGLRAWEALDAWLRAEGNARNPGTTADLIGAALFAGLVRGRLAPPWAWASSLASSEPSKAPG